MMSSAFAVISAALCAFQKANFKRIFRIRFARESRALSSTVGPWQLLIQLEACFHAGGGKLWLLAK
jgi:hypothetical protein